MTDVTRRFAKAGLTAAVALSLAAACDGPNGEMAATESDVGTVTAALSAVPASVTCVQFTLSGSTTGTQSFNTTPGGSPVKLDMGSLPAGNLTVLPKAYNVACSSVNGSTVPSWLGSATTVTVVPGQTVEINITLRANIPVAAKVDFAVSAVAVAAGDVTTYAILNDGTVRAWGTNVNGELGDGTTTTRLIPVAVSGLTDVKSVGAGSYHACALTNAGAVKCWGWNGYGQLGSGTYTSSTVPVAISSSQVFRGLAVGQGHACAWGSSYAANLCWGMGGNGQLCNGGTNGSASPVQYWMNATDFVVSGPVSYATMIFAGNGSSGFGSNWAGAFGTGSVADVVTGGPATGFTANGTRFITAAALGGGHACAVEATAGNVYCSGANANGQLGNGTVTNSSTPVAVTGLTNVKAVAAGSGHSCALKGDGTVWCWGLNSSGQLGDGTGSNRSAPVAVQKLTGTAVGIATGSAHSCAVMSDGSVWCWGNGLSGQLGDGAQTTRGLPVKVLL